MLSPDDLARLFHETYERLAPDHGYETRTASAVAWEDVPANNKSLMTAVAGEVLAAVVPAIRADERAEVASELDALQSDPPTIAYGAACVECNEDFEAGERVTWRWRYAPAGLIHDACRWDGDNAVLTEAQIRADLRAKVAAMLRDHAAGHRRTAERRGAMQYELVRRAVALEAAADRIARGEGR